MKIFIELDLDKLSIGAYSCFTEACWIISHVADALHYRLVGDISRRYIFDKDEEEIGMLEIK